MARVVDVLAKVLRVPGERLANGASFREFKEWDSLRHMEIVIAIEETWRITMEPKEMLALRSASDVEEILARHGVTLTE